MIEIKKDSIHPKKKLGITGINGVHLTWFDCYKLKTNQLNISNSIK